MNKMKFKSSLNIKLNIKKNDIILCIIILILVVSYILIKIFTYKSEPILLDYAKRKSTNIASTLIDKSINEVLHENEYENLIEIEKDNNGQIVNLNFNNKEINDILYLTTENLLKSVNLLENGKFRELDTEYIGDKELLYYIPIGVIHNIPVLVNIGPRIPFKIEILGAVDNKTETSVKEYGINSSIIEIYLNVNLQIQVILPFKKEKYKTKKNILLDSKIIQGKIPEYYGGSISYPISK